MAGAHGPRPLRQVIHLEVWLVPVTLVLAWHVAQARAQVWFFPSPADVARAFGPLLFSGEFGAVVAPSLLRLATGLSLGAALAIVIGTLFGSLQTVARVTQPLVDYLRSVPVVAFAPALMAIFGSTGSTRVGVIAFGAGMPVLVSTMDGVRRTDVLLLESAYVHGASPLGAALRVRLPAALPSVLSGLRIAIAVGIVMMIISELTGTGGTLGSYLRRAQVLHQIDKLVAGAVLLGATAWVLTAVMLAAQRRLMPWQEGERP